jgi:hypothetical protein
MTTEAEERNWAGKLPKKEGASKTFRHAAGLSNRYCRTITM